MSATATALVPTKYVAEAIDNAVLFSEEKFPVNPTIEVSIVDGELRTAGWTRYACLIDRRPCSTSEGEATALVDFAEAKELAKSGIRKVQGFASKGSQLRVDVSSEAVEFYDGSALLGRLERSEEAHHFEGDDERMGAYEMLYELESELLPGTLRQMRLLRGVLPKFGKVKMSVLEGEKWTAAQDEDPMDFHALKEQVVGVQYKFATIMQVSAGVVEMDEEEGSEGL